ncbi:DedA family protein [Patulibacter minatonensis]|uniref:DedA family protein n=1 Tax=Patulibacter minatonensis TaxID=298163 RepID=UPI0004B538D4|nr:DedA family protein [Patulibacter minatonensis]
MLTPSLAEISAPLALLPEWLSPEHIFIEYGLIAILIIIFAETGLLIGFFLPGDTLLLSAGILSYTQPDSDPLWMFLVFVPIAAVVGNLVGYEIGHKAGPALFTKEDSKFFRKDHIDRSRVFFEKYGTITVFLARFVPVVRTFTAVVAGAVGMDRRVFFIWSVLGAIAWCTGLILIGHLAAYALPKSTVDFIQGHIDLLIIGVVVLTIVGIVFEQRRHSRPKAAKATDGPDAPGAQPPADVE